MLFRRSRNKDDDPNDPYTAAAYDEDVSRYEKVRPLHVIATVLLAVIAVVAFFLTEDLTNSMALVDRYTILMAILLIASAVMILTGKKKYEKEYDGDEGK